LRWKSPPSRNSLRQSACPTTWPKGAKANAVRGSARTVKIFSSLTFQRPPPPRGTLPRKGSSWRTTFLDEQLRREGRMDVRSIQGVAPTIEHNGTVPVWWLVKPQEMRDITDGGFLELVSEFEVAGGGLVDPHSHPTHEFYYVTFGRGVMTVGDEEREIAQGDLVYTPPNVVHS